MSNSADVQPAASQAATSQAAIASRIPIAAHRSASTGKLRGPGIVIAADPSTKPRRESTRPYIEGQYAALLPVRTHLEPSEITGCSIELSADRQRVTLVERSPSRSPGHWITDDELHCVEIALAGGDYLRIEVRRFAADEPPLEGAAKLASQAGPSRLTKAAKQQQQRLTDHSPVSALPVLPILLAGVDTDHG